MTLGPGAALAAPDGPGGLRTAGLALRQETALDETVFSVSPADYRALCERLLEAGFDYPRCLSGADMEYGLRVTLHLQQLATGLKVVVRTELPYDRPSLASVSDLWGGVEWHEREAFDLVGISFEDHPDLRRILLEDDWTIHPLQRRYNTRGYLMPDWQPKPFPSPALWEDAPAAVPAGAATAVEPGSASSAAPAAQPAAPTAAAPDDAEGGERIRKPTKKWEPKAPAGSGAAATRPDVEASAPSPVAGPAEGSTGQTPAPAADPARENRLETAVSDQTGRAGTDLPSADPTQLGEKAAPIPSPTADVSQGRNTATGAEAPLATAEPVTAPPPAETPSGEPTGQADGEPPRKQHKRWVPRNTEPPQESDS